MILSSDELEVLAYLKSYKGEPVSMVEICRSAGGRAKYKESPHWAKRLMSRLVEGHLVSVNERGHYAYLEPAALAPVPAPASAPAPAEDYFAPADNPKIVGDDYFSPMESMPPTKAKKQWVAPHIENILKKAGKTPAKKSAA